MPRSRENIVRRVGKVAGADESPREVEELLTPIGKCCYEMPIRERKSYRGGGYLYLRPLSMEKGESPNFRM